MKYRFWARKSCQIIYSSRAIHGRSIGPKTISDLSFLNEALLQLSYPETQDLHHLACALSVMIT